MAEEETTPEEVGEPKEADEEENGMPPPPPCGPQPSLPHHPIDLAVTNLNASQNQAYQAYLECTGQPIVQAKHSDSHYDVQSGEELLITLTLASPVGPGEPSYVVDIEYEALQKGNKKTSGIFLYKQTTVAKFTPGLPNNGNLIQEFHLQTIKFDLERTNDGPADIAIKLFNGGYDVGKPGTGKFRLHP